MATSIFTRKSDLLYLIFFAIHIPTLLLVDLGQLYPASIKPTVVSDVRAWYVETYRDRFFTDPPVWFQAYMWMEAVYHLPFSFYAIPALLRDDPKTPIYLLIFAVQTAVTTLTCVVEALSWDVPGNDKIALMQLYVPYLALATFMGADMIRRLSMNLKQDRETQKKLE